ncbi:hypothetical protein WR25_10104 [Diploscapter pachys]|uniref:Cytochrome b-c1 complex subunit Rieske transmembrane domain-containing protein n=1 Tax=Diploscapter pachys TaxID=2018661 RepID=A0A2A2K505_9BILA|nr:hypothetical protein WR25_10104 [Diploscapter pachys]
MTTLTRSTTVAQKIICGGGKTPNIVLVAAPAAAKIAPLQEAPVERKTPSAMQSYASRRAEAGLFANGAAVKGINVTSRRLAHTDVTFPEMSKYRRDSTLDTHKPARETEEQRKVMQHAIYYGAGGAMALWSAKEVAQTLVYYKVNLDV